MPRKPVSPRTLAALRRLAKLRSGAFDSSHDEDAEQALLSLINDEMRALPWQVVQDIRDRVRFSCPPSPTVQSVVLMLDGLIAVKSILT